MQTKAKAVDEDSSLAGAVSESCVFAQTKYSVHSVCAQVLGLPACQRACAGTVQRHNGCVPV